MKLSNNPIAFISSNFIYNTCEWLIVKLQNINLIYFDKHVFSGLSIQLLETTDYRLCCIVSTNTKCTSNIPWYKSCQNLLPNGSIKLTFIVISVVIILENFLTILLHMKLEGMSDTYRKTVVIINLNDMICGIYLTLIWGADTYFGDSFMINESKWESNPLCLFAFALVSFFNLS